MAVNRYSTKAGVRYQVQIFRGGQRVASKGGFATRRAARKWEAEWVDEEPTDTGLLAVVNRYLDEMERKRARNTYSYKRTALRRLVAHMGQVGEVVDGLYRERGPKAANRNLREIRSFYFWSIRHGYLGGPNPAANIKPYPEEKYVPYVPPPEDVAAVRLVAQGKTRVLVDLLYFTGARLSEVLSLKWDDVGLKKTGGEAMDKETAWGVEGTEKRINPEQSLHNFLKYAEIFGKTPRLYKSVDGGVLHAEFWVYKETDPSSMQESESEIIHSPRYAPSLRDKATGGGSGHPEDSEGVRP